MKKIFGSKHHEGNYHILDKEIKVIFEKLPFKIIRRKDDDSPIFEINIERIPIFYIYYYFFEHYSKIVETFSIFQMYSIGNNIGFSEYYKYAALIEGITFFNSFQEAIIKLIIFKKYSKNGKKFHTY